MNNSDARFQLARHYRNELWRDQERKSRIYYAKQKEEKSRQDLKLHHIAVKDLIDKHKHNKVLINGQSGNECLEMEVGEWYATQSFKWGD